MTTKTRPRKGGDPSVPFAAIVLDADRYRDSDLLRVDHLKLGRDLATAGFYLLEVRVDRVVLAPPFAQSISEDSRMWSFQQWRPRARA